MRSRRHMRHAILEKLRTHLQEHYSSNLAEAINDGTSLHQLDALLAFKSEPYLDELRAAYERLEEGTFGVCLSCKQRIAGELMDADPTRRMCERCERLFSRVAVRYDGFIVPA